MKISDDYRAKIRLWAMRPTVVALPAGPRLPGFAAKKFQTHLELNQWKTSQLRKLAQTIVPKCEEEKKAASPKPDAV